jgi:hypothetical protein
MIIITYANSVYIEDKQNILLPFLKFLKFWFKAFRKLKLDLKTPL